MLDRIRRQTLNTLLLVLRKHQSAVEPLAQSSHSFNQAIGISHTAALGEGVGAGAGIKRSPSGAPFHCPKAVQPYRQEAELDCRLIFPSPYPCLFLFFLLCKAFSSTGKGWKVISGFPPADFHTTISLALSAGSGILSSDCCFLRSCGYGGHPLHVYCSQPPANVTWVSIQKKGLARKGNDLAYVPARTVHTDDYCGSAEL